MQKSQNKKPNNLDCHLNHSVSMAKQNNIDAPCFSDILAHARAIYLLRKFDITSLHFVTI